MSSKSENIQIFLDTMAHCHRNNYPISESIVYNQLPSISTRKYDTMKVSVVNRDTFSCCECLVKQGLSVMGLNMACHSQPGGGVMEGCFAQEENCFRRSNYFEALPLKLYPIPETGCIYTPIITVIKNEDYKLLDIPFIVAMVACAGIRHPKITQYGTYKNVNDRQLMKYKIEQIFQTGYKNNKNTLVLGALGTGAYGNPPLEVANIFNEVIQEYYQCFKYIVFAIKSHNDPNYDIFSRIIQQY